MFFFNDTATTEIYTLSLHDALPIYVRPQRHNSHASIPSLKARSTSARVKLADCASMNWHMYSWAYHHSPIVSYSSADRKSTRLNSSHANISYAVFCLKKKKYPSCHL